MSDNLKRRLVVLEGADSDAHAQSGLDRRTFLSLMSASLALASAAGCTRQPPENIVPYVKQPEEITPGKSLYYATSMILGGYATGLLVRSVTGRPIKVEGNRDHPASLGATDAFAQASVLTLYDPARAQVVTRLGKITSFQRFATEIEAALAAEKASGGAGVRILTEAVTSPSLAEQINGFIAAYPAAKWHCYEPRAGHNAYAAAELATGAPLFARYDLTRADAILALDSDFLASGPGALRYAHDFMERRSEAARHVHDAAPIEMSRLYCVESTPTCTGTVADHRLALRPSEVGLFAVAIAAELGVPGADRAPADRALSPVALRWARVIAADLRSRAGRALVVVGERAAPAVHTLGMAINEALGSVGSGALLYTDPVEASPIDPIASMRELCDDMRGGRVSLLVILGGNPVYTAPPDLAFTEAMMSAKLRVHLSLYQDETSERCHYHIPEAHYLEAWGDARAFDGAAGLVQPLIDPLYGGKSAIELVAALRGHPEAAGLDIVQSTWKTRLPAGRFDALFREALERGVIEGTAFAAKTATISPDAARSASTEIAAGVTDAQSHELIIQPDPTIDDGRFAQNAWLQELPKPHTKLTWDNAALLSPATAAALGVANEDVIELSLNGKTLRAPALILPGQSDRTVTIHLGYGRGRAAGIASGRGFDANRLRSSSALWHAPGVSITKTPERYPLAITQGHFRLEGRAHARTASLAAFRADPEIIQRMAEPAKASLFPPWPYEGRAWGMSIDIGACTGCNACIVACQAENNIPVVGKDQVIAGREMQWLRVDRYYEGPDEDPVALNQPMMCAHCETAPCEYVCPVGATTHSAEGLNEMTYNRCVGTRYCANNCPYKVRRFNFFKYQDDESKSLKLLRNPDVTVRTRGVMEKCSYCVQRISAARIDAEREARPVADGSLVTACQQACPTRAIVFGDTNDPAAHVRDLKADPRSYGVLAELGTRPRTTHLARLINKNPALDSAGDIAGDGHER